MIPMTMRAREVAEWYWIVQDSEKLHLVGWHELRIRKYDRIRKWVVGLVNHCVCSALLLPVQTFVTLLFFCDNSGKN